MNVMDPVGIIFLIFFSKNPGIPHIFYYQHSSAIRKTLKVPAVTTRLPRWGLLRVDKVFPLPPGLPCWGLLPEVGYMPLPGFHECMHLTLRCRVQILGEACNPLQGEGPSEGALGGVGRPYRLGEGPSEGAGSLQRVDGLLWYKDSGHHANGEFSMAVVQANNILEDQSQLESGPMSSIDSGPHGTFVGIYDGHAGPEASIFIRNRLFQNIKMICNAEFTSENKEMSGDVIRRAYLATDEEFLSLVKKQWDIKPQIASVGSCCLVGIVCSGTLYIANAGDSRVVLGRLEKTLKEIKAVQLSAEHNANQESVRKELHSLHPDDPHIVVLKHKVWRVKGIIQVSRSIGDAYLKKAEFNREPLLPKFRVPEPFKKPILVAEPSILVQKLHPEDQFLIFASDGLWEHLSSQEAVNIVNSCPRNGIARKLVKAALHEAAKKREMRYSDLKKIDRGVRRHFHDDITVIVLFLDSHLITRGSFRGPILSIKGGDANT